MFLVFCLSFVFLSSPASADAGIPMIVVIYPLGAIVLIPVILVEAFVMKNFGLSARSALKGSALANIISTTAGIPITWYLFSSMEDGSCNMTSGTVLGVITHAAILCPNGPQAPWVAPLAMLTLLVPLFFVSVLSESIVLIVLFKEKPARCLFKMCSVANCTSYLILAVFPLFALLHL